jgi:hypothetical protein
MGHKPWERAWRRADKARERHAAHQQMLDDMYDVVLVEQRMANDNGVRYSLEEVMAEFGITQADLDAVED